MEVAPDSIVEARPVAPEATAEVTLGWGVSRNVQVRLARTYISKDRGDAVDDLAVDCKGGCRSEEGVAGEVHDVGCVCGIA